MLMSLALAATAQCTCTESADVCKVAFATAAALPAALVSLVMAENVSTALATEPHGSLSVSVATAVPGVDTVPVRRKTSLPAATPPSTASRTAVASVVRSAVMWVTAMILSRNAFRAC